MVASGVVSRAFAQSIPEIGADPEFEPWRTWQDESSTGPLALVRAAILAANAYNSQPWLFHVTASNIDVYADTRRNLGAFDPYLREMHFSLGCALENLMIAAPAEGYAASLTLLPGALAPPVEAPRALVASISFAKRNRETHDLYHVIPHRHTNRNPYDAARPLPDDFTAALISRAAEDRVRLFLFTRDSDRKSIADVIMNASAEFGSDRNVQLGTQPWIRTTPAQMHNLRDGVLVNPKQSAPASLEAYRDLMLTGRLFGLIAVRDRYDRPDTLRAGRVWQRAHLLATSRGIAARPANGAVELIDHHRSLRQTPRSADTLATFTGDPAWQPTFMFYMGYATQEAPASPRRWLEQVIV
jgi:nitroreductase